MMTPEKFRLLVFTVGCVVAALIMGFSFNEEMNLRERLAPSLKAEVGGKAGQVNEILSNRQQGSSVSQKGDTFNEAVLGLDEGNPALKSPAYLEARKKITDFRNFALIGLGIVCLMIMSV